MPDEPETPFDTIEGALEYMGLLADSVEEARADIASELQRAGNGGGDQRQADALRLVAYKLDRLVEHAQASRRLLNDLRKLRRLLLDGVEEEQEPLPSPAIETEGEVELDG